MIRAVVDSFRDLLPIIVVIAFFQLIFLQPPFPNPSQIPIGLLAVVAGLSLFAQGLICGPAP